MEIFVNLWGQQNHTPAVQRREIRLTLVEAVPFKIQKSFERRVFARLSGCSQRFRDRNGRFPRCQMHRKPIRIKGVSLSHQRFLTFGVSHA